jgi:hypothetical protein
LITDLAGTDGSGSFDAFHPPQLLKIVQLYRIGPLVVTDGGESAEGGAPLDDGSDSEAQGTPPPENQITAPPAEDDSQVIVAGKNLLCTALRLIVGLLCMVMSMI